MVITSARLQEKGPNVSYGKLGVGCAANNSVQTPGGKGVQWVLKKRNCRFKCGKSFKRNEKEKSYRGSKKQRKWRKQDKMREIAWTKGQQVPEIDKKELESDNWRGKQKIGA